MRLGSHICREVGRAMKNSADEMVNPCNAHGSSEVNDVSVNPKNSCGFAADRHRSVDTTVGIQGDLPNCVFTLSPSTITAIIHRADIEHVCRRSLFAVCRKWKMTDDAFREERIDHTGAYSFQADSFFDAPPPTTISLSCGRLHARGGDAHGQCGIGASDMAVLGPRLIRLPPVL